MVTQSVRREIEEVVRAKNGEKFDVLMAIPGVYIVPEYNTEFERGRRIWSCKLEIDGVKYDIYLG